MEIKKAIEMMRQEQKSIIILQEQGVLPKRTVGTYYEALDMGISALEKQIPKRPNTRLDRIYATQVTVKVCPLCGEPAEHWGKKLNERDPYCRECGQALDWGD